MSSHYVPAGYLDATSADGPKVAAWLQERGLLDDMRHTGPTVDRRVRSWRAGECPSVGVLDRILLREFDVYIHELPDDVWLKRCYFLDVNRKVAA